MNNDRNSNLKSPETELSAMSAEERNARFIERLRNIDPEKWVEKIDQLAQAMQKKPKWSRSDERIDSQVEHIFFNLLHELVYSE